ncbi:hypothetical protein NDU88_003239 [Pleurodeles waltl]|uniref:Uncharacterized protein n=1 Tax=Pleurodeles waltl TaxID=8319 RepID=A0AAV7PHL0_PLEWA|nr:hypothetical protein NDU88_003239 [Pleurodeles waltl]
MALCWGPEGRRSGQAPGSSAKRPCLAHPLLAPLAWCVDAPGPRPLSEPSVMYTALEPMFYVPVTVGVLDGCFDSASGPVRALCLFRGLPGRLPQRLSVFIRLPDGVVGSTGPQMYEIIGRAGTGAILEVRR